MLNKIIHFEDSVNSKKDLVHEWVVDFLHNNFPNVSIKRHSRKTTPSHVTKIFYSHFEIYNYTLSSIPKTMSEEMWYSLDAKNDKPFLLYHMRHTGENTCDLQITVGVKNPSRALNVFRKITSMAIIGGLGAIWLFEIIKQETNTQALNTFIAKMSKNKTAGILDIPKEELRNKALIKQMPNLQEIIIQDDALTEDNLNYYLSLGKELINSTNNMLDTFTIVLTNKKLVFFKNKTNYLRISN